MTFASKKEADAHDKLLDMAEAFTDWLLQSGMQMDETQAENLGLYLAEQKESVQHILRTSKLPELNAATDKTASDADSSKKSGPSKPPDRQNDSSPVLLPRAGNGSRLYYGRLNLIFINRNPENTSCYLGLSASTFTLIFSLFASMVNIVLARSLSPPCTLSIRSCTRVIIRKFLFAG